ncbi:MAG: helix-turn-helix transcriptional regulator [Pseudomonadota bacterium]
MDINDIGSLGKRMLSIRKQKNLKQTNFSKLIGVSSSYLSLVELDKQRPSLVFIMSVLKATKVNADWLLMGKGSMYLPIKEEKEEIKEIDEYRVDYGAGNLPRDDDFKSHLDKLNDDQKRVLMVMADNSLGFDDELNDLKSHWGKLSDEQKKVLVGVVKEMIEKNEMKEFVSKLGATQLGELLQIPSLSES